MKNLLLLCLAILIAVSACGLAVAGEVNLPADHNATYVSVYANNAAHAKQIVAANPELSKYIGSSHYNVYTKDNPMAKARFANVEAGSAYVQKSDGTVIWANRRWCPFRRDEAPPKKDEAPPAVEDEDTSPPPALPDPGPSPWVVLAVAVAGLVAGAGSKFAEELRG